MSNKPVYRCYKSLFMALKALLENIDFHPADVPKYYVKIMDGDVL